MLFVWTTDGIAALLHRRLRLPDRLSRCVSLEVYCLLK